MIERYRQLLAFINERVGTSGGLAPSRDEMFAALGYPSRGQVTRDIVELEGRGLIRRIAGKPRSIYLTDAGFALLRNREVKA